MDVTQPRGHSARSALPGSSRANSAVAQLASPSGDRHLALTGNRVAVGSPSSGSTSGHRRFARRRRDGNGFGKVPRLRHADHHVDSRWRWISACRPVRSLPRTHKSARERSTTHVERSRNSWYPRGNGRRRQQRGRTSLGKTPCQRDLDQSRHAPLFAATRS